jgi:hypothetical protein
MVGAKSASNNQIRAGLDELHAVRALVQPEPAALDRQRKSSLVGIAPNTILV